MSVEVTVVASAQTWSPRRAVDQLRGDANAVAGLAHAAFEHVADAELAARRRRRSTDWPLNVKAVLRAITAERRDLRQVRRDVLADPVAEIFLLGIAAHVLERQHADRNAGCALSRRFRRAAGRPGERLDAGRRACASPALRCRRPSPLRSAHWIWLNGIGGIGAVERRLDQRSGDRAPHRLRRAPIAISPLPPTTAPRPPSPTSAAPR